MKALDSFPDDFLWGSSISAYQAEGGVEEGGKHLSVADISTQKEGYSDNSTASDFFHHYKEDIQLLANMHAKAFRFSLAWPRIMPEGEKRINKEGVAFYHAVLDELEKYNIKPIVTLFHYDLPLSLHKKYGGWNNRKTVDAFENYAKFCFEEFGHRIKMYMTINEPDILFMYGGHGLDIDGVEIFQRDKLRINHHFALAHAKAVALCHKLVPDAMIGPVFGYVPVYPKTSNPIDVMAAKNASDVQNAFFQELFLNGNYLTHVLDSYPNSLPVDIEDGDIKLIKQNKSDFIALNYYKSDVAEGIKEGDKVNDFILCNNEYLQATEWGWDIDAIGIRYMLREIFNRYHLPVFISENGIAHSESIERPVQDDYRIDYYQHHLHECKLAIKEGVKLLGYCNWSFIDLLSTSQGFEKRYGLVSVKKNEKGVSTLERIPKKSYKWYKKIIEQNGKEL